MNSSSGRIFLGVDGGGSKTAVLIASLTEAGQIQVPGRGRGGPSDLRLAGKDQSPASLNKTVDEPVNGCLKIARKNLAEPDSE